jgi:diacylglycerol O-acyltransferase
MKPLSPTDMLFLMMETSTSPMHVAGLQLFTLPDDADENFIQDLVHSARQHTKAKGRFNLYPTSKFGRKYWAEEQDFDVEYHFRHIALPKPGRIRELLSLVSRLHATPLDHSRPLWEFSIIEGLADGRFAVYSKVHHALFDGVSAMMTSQRSLSTTPDERDRPPVWAQERRKKVAGELKHVEAVHPAMALLDAVSEGMEMLPGVRQGLRDLFGNASKDKALPFRTPATMFNVATSSSRRFAADDYDLARFKNVAKHFKGTLNDVVLAVCGGALREYMLAHGTLPKEPLIAMIPVSIRSAETGDDGNQVSLILASLGTHIADPVARLEHVIRSTTAAKKDLEKLSHMDRIAYAAALLSPMPLAQVTGYMKHPAFNVVISNVPGPKETLYFNGARMDSTYPVSIVVNGQALNITLNSYNGVLSWGFIACRRAVPQVQRLLDHTEKALSELEEAMKAADK